MSHNAHLICMWNNKSDFLIIVSASTRGTNYHPLSEYLFIFNKISFLFHPEFIVDNKRIYTM